MKNKKEIKCNNEKIINKIINQESYKQERVEKIISNIIFFGITIPIQIFQSIGVFIIAYFNASFTELLIFLIGFFFTRSFLGETLHMHSTIACTTITWTIFFLVTRFLPSTAISIFLCLILGCSLAIFMNYIVVKDDIQCQKD